MLAPHEHVHRRWADVRALIDGAELPARASARAHETFRLLAVAEGRIHGTGPEEVHFHEVGAIDALADVCGVSLALESLDVERVVVSPLPASRGFVRAAHGRLPLPAPAVLEILRGVPIVPLEVDRELVTPTGAALARRGGRALRPDPGRCASARSATAPARATSRRSRTSCASSWPRARAWPRRWS